MPLEEGRGLLEEELQSLANGFGDHLLVDGVEYKGTSLVRSSTTAWGGHVARTPVQLPPGGRPQRADHRASGLGRGIR